MLFFNVFICIFNIFAISQAGLIFWTDIEEGEAKIERAQLDGTNRKIVIGQPSIDIKAPRGLALDLNRRRLFWCDTDLNGLFSTDYEGQNRQALLKDQTTKWLSKPISISFFEDRIYWLDQTFNRGSVASVSTTIITDSPELLAMNVGHDIHDIKILSDKNQQGLLFCLC